LLAEFLEKELKEESYEVKLTTKVSWSFIQLDYLDMA